MSDAAAVRTATKLLREQQETRRYESLLSHTYTVQYMVLSLSNEDYRDPTSLLM